ALGICPELQGGLRAIPCLYAGTGTDSVAFRGGRCSSGHAPAAWLPACHAGGRGGIPVPGDPPFLAVGSLSRSGLLSLGTPADPATGAVHVLVADPGAVASAYAVLLRLAAAIARPAATLD